MKQTIVILTALAAVLLLLTGFITANGFAQSRTIELYKEEIQHLQSRQKELQTALEKMTKAEETSAEAAREAQTERAAAQKQFEEMGLALQKAVEEAEKLAVEKQKQQQELEMLAAEYEDLNQTCDALETRVAQLDQQAVQMIASHQAQTLADARRIEELESELEKAAIPAQTVSPRATLVPMQ